MKSEANLIALTLVVPLYNEENCLERNFHRIKEYLSTLGKDFEILLVNDGSVDRTAKITDNLVRVNREVRAIHIPRNKGKGFAVKKGVLSSRGAFVFFTDADLAVPVTFIGNCLERLESGSPVVIGSRHLPHSTFRIRQGFARQFLGEIFRRWARVVLFLKVSDVTCGLKGFESGAAREIFIRSRIDRWGYDAEILFLAARLGYDISEVPVEWSHHENSKVRIASASVRTFAEIGEIYYNYLIAKRYDLHRRGRKGCGSARGSG